MTEKVSATTFQKLAPYRIIDVKPRLTGVNFRLDKITGKQTNKIKEVTTCMITVN